MASLDGMLAMVTGGKSRITSDVDFDRAGKQVSWLRLPYSSNTSAHGAICIPIAVIKNGTGKTAYLQAGAHGDEYEGQIALVKLIRDLDAAEVQGRIVIVPAANLPAANAGLRCSPIDMGNLNRTYPGDRDGTPTEMIAHYIDTVLMPLANVFQDLHSGGNTLRFLPMAQTRLAGKNPRAAECLSALKAFGAPLGLITYDNGEERIGSFSAYKAGAVALSSELGGGGQVSLEGLAVAERGIRNVLAHFEIIEKQQESSDSTPTRLIESRGASYRVYASDRGVFEPIL